MEIAGRNEKGSRRAGHVSTHTMLLFLFKLLSWPGQVLCTYFRVHLSQAAFWLCCPWGALGRNVDRWSWVVNLTFQQEIAFLLHQVANRFWSIMVTWSDFSSFLHVSVQLSFLFCLTAKKPGQSPQCRQCHVRHATMISSFQRFFFLFSLIWNDHKFCYRFWQYFFKSDRPGRLNQAEPLNSTF